ncbi:hypothetical protein ACLB2K_054428 [Fragaria x ananassa]
MSAETVMEQPKASHGDNGVEKLRKFFEKFMLEEGVGVEDLRFLFEKLMVNNNEGVDELRKGLEEFMLKEKKEADDDESKEQSKENQQKQEKTICARSKRRCASRPNKLPVLNLRPNRKYIPGLRHYWLVKDEFLEGESGIEKPPYQLPSYIAATGIEEIRQNQRQDNLRPNRIYIPVPRHWLVKDESLEGATGIEETIQNQREDNNKLEAVRGNYQELYDAFFKYQTKPKLTAVGDLYYEGKEFDQIQVSLRDQNHQMKNCWVRGAVELTKHYRDLEKEEERLYHDMVAELEKKKKRKMKKD